MAALDRQLSIQAKRPDPIGAFGLAAAGLNNSHVSFDLTADNERPGPRHTNLPDVSKT
jgi:hypothetical protein